MPQPSSQLTAISLFTGAGGMDIGFERAGFTTIFANELDPHAATTYRSNRTNAHMHEGSLLDYMDKINEIAKVDLVYGGPPCQGFSVAGKMDPNDERSKLIWSFLDVVKMTRPKVFALENVRALGVLSRWHSVREKIISTAQSFGYQCFYRILAASDYGVPQNRERVIFIGVKGKPKIEEFDRELALCRKEPSSLRQTLLSVGKYGSLSNPKTCTAHVSLAKTPVMRRSPYAGMLVNGAGRPINFDGSAQTLPASMGGNKTPIIDQSALENPDKTNWFVDYHTGILEGKIKPGHTEVPSTIRRLTISEAAAIQSFPSEYRFCGPKTAQYKQIGNAVAVDFAYAIASCIKKIYF